MSCSPLSRATPYTHWSSVDSFMSKRDRPLKRPLLWLFAWSRVCGEEGGSELIGSSRPLRLWGADTPDVVYRLGSSAPACSTCLLPGFYYILRTLSAP